MEKTSKKSSPRLQLIISVMIIAALFLAELYVMINESANVVLVVGIGILILIALYFAIDAALDCANEKDIANREQYDNIYRSEKASYMLMKKHLEEMNKQLRSINQGGGKAEDHSAEIIKAQKAIAKISMGKTKESQDRLFIELNNLEASLKDSIFGLSMKLSGFQEEIERLADHLAAINTEAIHEAAKKTKSIAEVPDPIDTIEEFITDENADFMMEDPESFGVGDVFKDDIMMDEVEEDVPAEEEVLEDSAEEFMMEEPLIDESELDVEEKLDILEDDDSEIDFANLDLDTEEESDVLVESEEDILNQLLAAEESEEIEEEVDALEELAKAVDTPVVEEAPAPTTAPADNGGKMGQDDIAALIASMAGGDAAPAEEVKPEPAPAPAPADNGGKMGQDDIAALIASMTGGDAAPAEEVKPEPAPAPAPTDNPNRMMTPEEIAALIAGTNS